MAHLFILALCFVFISAGLIDREECCSEKTVGGVHYTLVEKTNTEVYNCLSNCVYIRTGESGSRFCFAKGNQQVECNNAGLVVGILNAGGDDVGTSTELFLPGSGSGCKLADLPHKRFVCTLDTDKSKTGVLCGNGPSLPGVNPNNTRTTCINFSPNTATGTWNLYPSPTYQLQEERTGHSSWVEPDGNLLLMGGTPGFLTTEIVGVGGLPFKLKHPTIYACSIQQTDYVFLTGGQFSPTIVTKYNTKGYVESSVPSLPGGRYHHGCGSYQDGTVTILVVAGGIAPDDKTILSSTLMHTIDKGSGWTDGKPLPTPGALYAMASVSYDNVIYLIGGNGDSTNTVTKSTTQILKCIKTNDEVTCSIFMIQEVPVTLKDARSFGAATKLMVDPGVCG